MTEFEPWRARREDLEIVTRWVKLDWGPSIDVVEFQLSGRSFTELVAESERAEDAEPSLAGGYMGLGRDEVDWRRHLLGESTGKGGLWLDGRTLLLGCICSEWECWPLYARITVDESSVFWHDFDNPYRDWTYAELGPFRFDRAAYEHQVARVARADR